MHLFLSKPSQFLIYNNIIGRRDIILDKNNKQNILSILIFSGFNLIGIPAILLTKISSITNNLFSIVLFIILL